MLELKNFANSLTVQQDVADIKMNISLSMSQDTPNGAGTLVRVANAFVKQDSNNTEAIVRA